MSAVQRDDAYWADVRQAVGCGAPSVLLGTSQRSLDRAVEQTRAAYLGVQTVDVVPDSDQEDPLWHWHVEGTAEASGTMVRGFDDSGIIQAEGAGDALNWLVHQGPFWDGLDAGEEFTITIRPATEADGG